MATMSFWQANPVTHDSQTKLCYEDTMRNMLLLIISHVEVSDEHSGGKWNSLYIHFELIFIVLDLCD